VSERRVVLPGEGAVEEPEAGTHGVRLAPDALAATLRGRRPRRVRSLLAPRRAAVAAILRHAADGPALLLMQRARREGDSWSGQISMPGGMASPQDTHTRRTAERETLEEVGMDLRDCGVVLGRSDDQIAIAKGRKLPLAITPWVFHVPEPPPLVLNDEAESAFWLPLLPLVRGELDDVYLYEMAGLQHRLPAWRYEGYVVWGLTHRMISRLLQITGLR
jgi:8-oxo-dGTP pyrophosphatase MutT (NUDIX family)